MSLTARLSCLVDKHEPNRRHVRREGRDYLGQCRHCGKDIRRIAHRDWRKNAG